MNAATETEGPHEFWQFATEAPHEFWHLAIRAWRNNIDTWPVEALLRDPRIPIPDFARAFLADVFTGKVKKRKGRPGLTSTMPGTLLAAARGGPAEHALLRKLGFEPHTLLPPRPAKELKIAADYEAALKQARDDPKRCGGPSEVAADHTAAKHRIDERTVHEIRKRVRATTPPIAAK